MNMTPAPPKQETPIEECRRILNTLKDHNILVDRRTLVRCMEFLLALKVPDGALLRLNDALNFMDSGDVGSAYEELKALRDTLSLNPTDGPPAIPIKKPVIIVHDPGDGKLITMLGGPGGELPYDARHYGVILCDIARHVARALGDESAVETIYEYFKKELDRPTTKLEGWRLS